MELRYVVYGFEELKEELSSWHTIHYNPSGSFLTALGVGVRVKLTSRFSYTPLLIFRAGWHKYARWSNGIDLENYFNIQVIDGLLEVSPGLFFFFWCGKGYFYI